MSVAEPCPGSCNRDHRSNPDGDIAARLGDPVWCLSCQRRIRRALGELLELHVYLELDQGARTRLAEMGSIRGGGNGHPSPSTQVDMQDETLQLLLWIEDEIRAARPGVVGRYARSARLAPSAGSWTLETLPAGFYGPPRLLADTTGATRTPQARRVASPADRSLSSSVRFVTAHLDWLLDNEDPGRWAGRKILSQHAMLRSATATGSGLSRRTQRCPRCKLRALVQESGSDYIHCEGCGRLVSLDEYARLCAPEKQEEAS